MAKPKLTHSIIVTYYGGFDSTYDDRIDAAFEMKGVECAGSGCGFGARDLEYYVYDNANLSDVKAAVRRVRRWKKFKTPICVYLDAFSAEELADLGE